MTRIASTPQNIPAFTPDEIFDDVTRLALERIRVDGRAQLRAASSPATVADYAAALRGGATFAPIVVFHSEVLFDSSRSYAAQIDTYRAWQNGDRSAAGDAP